MLSIFPIPALKDNYIWTLHDRRHAVVVDLGEAAPVRAYLDAHQLKLAAILCTHHHNDHTGGICELAELYNVPVYGPRQENIPCVSHPLGEGDVVKITKPRRTGCKPTGYLASLPTSVAAQSIGILTLCGLG